MRKVTISLATKSYATNARSARQIKNYLSQVEEISSDPQTFLEVKYRIEELLKEHNVKENGYITPGLTFEILHKLGPTDEYIASDNEQSIHLAKYNIMKKRTSRALAALFTIGGLTLTYVFLSSIIYLFASTGTAYDGCDYWTLFYQRYTVNELQIYFIQLISFFLPLPAIALTVYRLMRVKRVPKYLITLLIASILMSLILFTSSLLI